MKILTSLLFISFFITNIYAKVTLIKKENNDSNTTLLVIGGIHGNEPGGYYAATILAEHYTIVSKNLWVVPNLNYNSILKYRRGINGDMNRKFAYIKKNDKDKKIVEAIKKIILNPKVSLILNLHDGHGFYRSKSQGSIYNPKAWGQTCVIDQCKLIDKRPFCDLNKIATTVKDNINKKLLAKHHTFNVKNTNTKKAHYKDMEESLTYFAIKHLKPAFAIETSKNLSSVTEKVFYQLVAIEEYMKVMKIKYKRDFKLNQKSIKRLINNFGQLTINNNIKLNLNGIKKHIKYFPLKSNNNIFKFTNPLGMIKKEHGIYKVFIANHLITKLKPQYFKLSNSCNNNFTFIVDGKKVKAKKASEIFANDDFKVITSKGIRVNIIGYYKKGLTTESNIDIFYNNLDKNYAIDRHNKIFRVEFYKDHKFCSTIMIHFEQE